MCTRPKMAVKRKEGYRLVTKQQLIEYNWKNENNNFILVKCGKCKECKKEKMLEMIERIKKEMSFWEKNTIATLTYKEEKEENKKDITLFIKNLRNKGYKIRYYYCGEKGKEKNRFHYHIIIFNYYPEDSEYYKKSKKGNTQYISKELNNIWGKGLVTHGIMNTSCASYVVKYMMKNEKIISNWSRKPPLGIKENISAEELKKEIDNDIYSHKYKKSHFKTISGKKYVNKEKEKMIEEESKERIKHIEDLTSMKYKKYLIKRNYSLDN